MSDAAARLSDSELDALTQRLNARPLPRDASVMAATSRRVVDIASHRRQPLGLRPVIEPGDEPEDEDRAEVTSEARYAEIMAWRTAHGGNRGAFLSDIDALIERASKTERRFVFAVVGEILGETMAELGHDLRKEFGRTPETPEAQVALRVEVSELRAALAESRAEVRELKLIQENMRTASRGERGEQGARGVQGTQGPIGPRGEKGERSSGRKLFGQPCGL